GVSRVSVREAYRALQDAGVVTVRRGSTGGAFITAPDPARISEAMWLAVRLDESSDRLIREASLIGPLVAALAARHASRADLERLRKTLTVPAAARAPQVGRHRARFLLAVADCAHNLLLTAVVTALTRVSDPRVKAFERIP